jgi:hypothetical protein
MNDLIDYEELPTRPVFNLQHNLAEYNDFVANKYESKVAALDAYDIPSPPSVNVNFNERKTYAANVLGLDKYGIKDEHKQLIAEIKVRDEDIEPEPVIEKTVDRAEEIESDIGFTTHLKLNAVGMIAVVSFIAVTLMVLAFIIVNGIVIGKTNTKISTLRAENAAIQNSILAQQSINAAALSEASAGLTKEYYESLGYSKDNVEYVAIPSGEWKPIGNPDASTNFFDGLAKFFNKLFA